MHNQTFYWVCLHPYGQQEKITSLKWAKLSKAIFHKNQFGGQFIDPETTDKSRLIQLGKKQRFELK